MLQRPMAPANNSPAMLAASQAFTGSQGQQSRLAAGAAAQALRSMSPVSTPVGQIQTRRMVQRQNSMSSVQGTPRGRSRGDNLVRRGSSSSMTERTFRAESPGRPSTSGGLPSSRQSQPPVPPLPQTYADVPAIPKKSQRRSASIDDIQLRKNNQRQAMERHSLAVAPTSKPAVDPAFAAAKRVSTGANPQLSRTDSQNSMHFSYPGRAKSPPPQKQKFDSPRSQVAHQTRPAAPSRGISDSEARTIQQDLTQTAQQPVKKKKKREGPLTEGSRLQTGTMGHKPVVTQLAPGPPSPISPADSRGSDSESDPRAQARRAQRASGVLAKQPSVVREDWEGELEDTPSSPIDASPVPTRGAPSKRQTAEANVSRKIEQADSAQPPQHLGVSSAARKPSLSPSRSARFSSRLSSDMAQGQKHEPLPRSVSPRKPALKTSNSPQILPVDKQRAREPSLTPSDMTDISADSAPRRKKATHVKFDNHPEIVGAAAESGSPSTPQIVSPQHKEKDRRWFGKKPTRVVLDEDSDGEDAMKPRPQLPTFGSVRNGRRNEVESSLRQPVASSPSSSSSSSVSLDTRPTTMDTSISSDHALGGLLTRDREQKRVAGQQPLAPEVTSVEGTGLHSDNESVYSQDNHNYVEPPVQTFSAYQQATTQEETASHPLSNVDNAADVPTIALQPATPGIEEEPKHKDQWLVEVPGGFPSAYSEVTVAAPQTEVAASRQAEPDPVSSTSVYQPSWQDDAQARYDIMPAIQEEESDKDSIYSDAEEDMDGDGFGSINAIVRSPVLASPTAHSSPPASPVTAAPQRDVERESEQIPSDWNDVGARWKVHRESLQRAALQPAPEIVEKHAPPPTHQAAQKATSSRTQKKAASPVPTAKSTPKATQPAAPTGAVRAARASAQPGSRQSMRPEPKGVPAPTLRARAGSFEDPNPTMRSSMRNSAGPPPSNEAPRPKKSSMRHSAAPTAPVAASPQYQAPATLQKKNLRNSAPPPARTALPPVNNESDSESSFKKRRRARANERSAQGMRRSMRAGREAEPVSPAQAREVARPQAVQPQSPVDRRALSPGGGQSSMRMTMRGSMDNTPTMRGNQNNGPTMRGNQNNGSAKRSSSLFGRKRDAKSPTRPMSAMGFGRSRTADSDDEGDRRPNRTYKSRFSNSSDEEVDLPPVRGIPRRNRDDDSTDLEDSSDEERTRGKKAAPRKKTSVATPSSPQVPDRPTSPVSPGEKKKRGFFGRMKKGKDETDGPTGNEPQPAANGNSRTTTGARQNANTVSASMGAEAQKEALMEQARRKLEASGEISKSTRPTSPTGKLQRRVTPSRTMSDSWPLPGNVPEYGTTDGRPVTSDGANPRPGIRDHQRSSDTAVQESGEGQEKGAKKKKFGLLRRAFGMKN